MSNFQSDRVGKIPISWFEPKQDPGSRTLVIWIPGFSGSKEDMEPYLADLTSAGFFALSFDPHQHGERMVDPSREAFTNRVRGNLRRYFWPILAETAKDASTVVDWAVKHLGVREVAGMGGISAGASHQSLGTSFASNPSDGRHRLPFLDSLGPASSRDLRKATVSPASLIAVPFDRSRTANPHLRC